MKKRTLVVVAGAMSVAVAFAATNTPEKTMAVARCLAVDAKGVQCPHQATPGKDYCWRHHGFVKAMNEAADDASKGANKAWTSTKQWSTNTWQKTKDGAQSAWDSTKEAADKTRVGAIEMLGGKDAK